jgi:hypothetical protein
MKLRDLAIVRAIPMTKQMVWLLIAFVGVATCCFAQSGEGIPAHGKMVRLFDGKDLAGFDILLKSQGVNKDPEHVFSVEHGVIHVSGNDFGGIVTQKSYENYYLRAEFKWGEKTYQDKVGKARDCGILYHIDEPLTEVPQDVWPRAFEFQIQEGGTGDIWLVKGRDERREAGTGAVCEVAAVWRRRLEGCYRLSVSQWRSGEAAWGMESAGVGSRSRSRQIFCEREAGERSYRAECDEGEDPLSDRGR